MKMFVVNYEEILNDAAKMQHTAFGEGLIRSKRTKFALQIARKAPKCPLEYVNFQKVLGNMPRTPKNHFCFPVCFKFNFSRKNALKKCQNLVLKVLNILPSHGHIFKKKAYLCPLLGLTSFHSVNIPPHSKLHFPHTEIFWIRPCRFRSFSPGLVSVQLAILLPCEAARL